MSEARPLLLMDVGEALDALEAHGGPRLTPRGYELLDDGRIADGPIQRLRHAAREAARRRRWYRESERELGQWPVVVWPGEMTAAGQRPVPPSVVLHDCGDAMREMHQSLLPHAAAFAGTRLQPTMSYGPRLYRRGSVLLMHVDRYPSHEIGISVVLSGPRWEMHLVDASMARLQPASETTSEHTHILYEGCRMMHGCPTPLRAQRVAAFFHYRRCEAST